MEDEKSLEERVNQFNTLQLPGQPMSMHMGTSYLVNDLWREVKHLRGDNRLARIKELLSHFPPGPFKWAQVYQIGDYDFHWAIIDPVSDKKGLVTDIYTISFYEESKCMDGRPWDQQEMPALLIEALNFVADLVKAKS